MIQLPEMLAVNSSNIKSIGYDGTDLYVEYLSGSVYQYKNVPQGQFESLKTAESKGRFMNENIKGKFNYDYLR